LLLSVISVGLDGAQSNLSDAVVAKTTLMQSARFTLLSKALSETACGIELLSPLVALEQDTAQDILGDSRFDGALACFQDEAMFQVCLQVTEDDLCMLVVKNHELVDMSPMMIERVLAGSLAQLAEAAKLWSPLRTEWWQNDLMRFVEKFTRTLNAIDVVFVMKMRQQCHCLFSSSAHTRGNDSEDLQRELQEISQPLQAVAPTNTNNMINSLSNIGNLFPKLGKLQETITRAIEGAKHNATIREQIVNFMGCLGRVGEMGMPANATDVVKQWQARGEDCCLTHAVDLIKYAVELQTAGFFHMKDICVADADQSFLSSETVHMECCIVHMGKSDDNPTLADLAGTSTHLASLPVVVYCKSMVQQCTSVLAEHLWGSLGLECIKVPHEDAIAHTHGQDKLISDISDIFVDRVIAHDIVATLSKHLASQNEFELPSISTFAVLEKIIASIGNEKVVCGCIATEPLPVDEFLNACELYVIINQIASAISWLGSQCMSTPLCTTDYSVKPQLEAALDMLSHSLADATEHLEKWTDTMGDAFLDIDYLVLAPRKCKAST
jgi:hypothetical protein